MAHSLTIEQVEVHDLDIALREPFGIATGAQLAAENLLVRVRLASGHEGLGEAAPFTAVNGETRASARAALLEMAPAVRGRDARAWRSLGEMLRRIAPRASSAVCAVEMAVLDALGRALDVPLWVLFGGASTTLDTDCTVTTGTVEAAGRAAAQIARDGFHMLKLKVGGAPVSHDIARVEAAVAAFARGEILLDANGGMASVDDAVRLVEAARRTGARVVLFEQPMPADDLEGLRAVGARSGAPIAADESVTSAADVVRVAEQRAARVVNLKIMKSGIAEALDMAATARAHGLGLMIGGMVESALAMTTSACLAAGQGGFAFADLDTPMFLVDAPFDGGFVQRGPRLDLSAIRGGHGVTLR